MSRTIFFIVFLSIIALIEVYSFYGLRTALRPGLPLKIGRGVHLLGVAITVITLIGAFLTMRQGLNTPGPVRNWLMGLMITFFVTKLSFSLVLVLDDVVRVFQFGLNKVAGLFGGSPSPGMVGRRKFVAQAGLILAAIPFTSFLYGVIKGKYAYEVHRIKLAFKDLPESFHGMRIVQISDIHSGSFDDKEAVAEGVRMIQAEKPDLLLFTGDLVNNMAFEIEPYLDLFGGLTAPMGKFSVMGNHDYGNYVPWESKQEKAENEAKIRAHHQAMGYRLMQNESVLLTKGEESIRLAGVENWGLPPFPQLGDLDKAFSGIQDNEFTILMSHDPTHWEEKVLPHGKKVHLTLSGHTHGFQMGIEVAGIKWSPVQWRYKQWAGLYTEAEQHLYVNRGFGFIGFPGRVGIWPEITVIELERA